jgi:hypothetical protein
VGDAAHVTPVLAVAAGLLLLLRRPPPGRWVQAIVVILAVLPLVLLYVLNPFFRVFSRHGLLHASILYQILEHGVPPPNPLLAGETLGYHWSYDLLGAAVCRVTGLPPSWSYAAINVVCLLLVMLLLARVSRGLVDVPGRGLLGPLVGLFAMAPVPLWWLKGELAANGLALLMARGTPVFQKFANTNGVPVGLVCFALAVVCLSTSAGGASRLVLLALSVAGCGVLYPPILPGLLLTVAVFSLVDLLHGRGARFRDVALHVASTGVGLGAAAGAHLAMGLGGSTRVSWFDTTFLAADSLSLVLTLLPMTVVIVVAWPGVRRRADGSLLVQLLAAAAANGGCFLALSLTDRNEYKLLIVSQVLLGLVGGPALMALRERFGLTATAVAAVLLMGSFVHIYANCSGQHREAEVVLVERGRRLVHPDGEQDALYRWVREHTPSTAVFVDSEHLITVLGPRALLVAHRDASARRRTEAGRGFLHRVDLFATRFSGNDATLVTSRRKLVQSLLSSTEGGAERCRRLLRAVGVSPLYVVCREPVVQQRLAELGAEEVFRTGDDRVVVMRWTAGE